MKIQTTKVLTIDDSDGTDIRRNLVGGYYTPTHPVPLQRIRKWLDKRGVKETETFLVIHEYSQKSFEEEMKHHIASLNHKHD